MTFIANLSILSSAALLASSITIANAVEPTLSRKMTKEPSLSEGSLSLELHSRYFLEGRDVLEGDSVFTSALELNYGNLLAGVWYGYSLDQDYEELHISLSKSHTIGDVELSVGYTHLRFPHDGEHDHEVSIGAV